MRVTPIGKLYVKPTSQLEARSAYARGARSTVHLEKVEARVEARSDKPVLALLSNSEMNVSFPK